MTIETRITNEIPFMRSVAKRMNYPEDVIQEALLKAITSDSRYKVLGTRRDVRSWLARIMCNCFIIDRRRVHGRKNYQFVSIDNLDSILPASNKDPEIFTSSMIEAIDAIPVDLRVTYLFDILGYSNKEIASFLSIDPTTVGTRVCRAKKILIKFMNPPAKAA